MGGSRRIRSKKAKSEKTQGACASSHHVKATAEQLALKHAGSFADWLERLIVAEAARSDD
jgi:hypothetical protein